MFVIVRILFMYSIYYILKSFYRMIHFRSAFGERKSALNLITTHYCFIIYTASNRIKAFTKTRQCKQHCLTQLDTTRTTCTLFTLTSLWRPLTMALWFSRSSRALLILIYFNLFHFGESRS